MNSKTNIIITQPTSFIDKAKALVELTKPKLNLLVVFSSLMGYLMASNSFVLLDFLMLAIAGYLITGSANVFNQIIEKDLDGKMQRTRNRPIPTGRVTVMESAIMGGLFLAIGMYLLFYFLNPLSAWLSLFSWALYVLVYTPLKQKTPLCVFIGAFPGAFPPMLGWISVTGSFGLEPGLLFLAQFAWQFPHFWAIAWKQYDQYHGAGFKMLPLDGGKNKRNATIILLYTIFTIPASMLLYHFEMSGLLYYFIAIGIGLYFTYLAYDFYLKRTDKSALNLMFASFAYLPILQITMVLDKI